MPNCDFYAAPGDYESILRFVFEDLDCRVFEAYSRIDNELREFFGPAEIVELPELGVGEAPCSLVLWPVVASRKVEICRIDLASSANLGSHRYMVRGWGLIQLDLGGFSRKGLHRSHTNHNTEKRALKWYLAEEGMGHPSEWEWPIVTGTSSQLNRKIRGLARAKHGSRPILPAAKILLDSGARLRET